MNLKGLDRKLRHPNHFNGGIIIHILANKPKHPSLLGNNYTQPNPALPNQTNHAPIQWPWIRASRHKDTVIQPRMMQEASLDDLLEYLSAMIHAHSLRVEQYRFLLGCSAEEVERDIKEKMNGVRRSLR
ncbi:hypothetical protein ACGC1H_003429 [Rhizoctonia solani]